MKALWIVNLIPSELCKKLNIPSENLGGWIESMADEIIKHNDIELAVACKCDSEIEFQETLNNIQYYSLYYDSSVKQSDLEKTCKSIVERVRPDIIHIWGTEFIHAKAMCMVSKKLNIPSVISIQGVLNGQYQYQCGQLPMDELMFNKSLTKSFSAWMLHFRKTKWFRKRLKIEAETFQYAKNIIGRTTWDKAHTYALNPDANYYFCNETLRASFYQKKWDINNVERHSIYIGNGYYALKGAHFLIMALPQLIKEYPDIKVYIAGVKPYKKDDKRPFYKKGYGAFLEKLINELNVEQHIVFTGTLTENEVADRLAKTHMYVLCSTIENSPNTLGEAMLIGTPSVSAYVGGVPDMATNEIETLYYRNDDPVLLAWNIKRVFDDDKLALKLSDNSRKRAHITHDQTINSKKMIDIYQDIICR